MPEVILEFFSIEQLIALADMFEVSTDDLLGRGSADNEELFALREQLRRDPNIRVLFSIAKKASPEHVKAAAAMLKALEPNQEGYFPDE